VREQELPVRRPAAARQDAIRRHNLGLILQQVHFDGALTRAELTARSGLSRSTIGDLVAELATLGLLAESVPSGGPGVGRPSHVVGSRADGPYAVAIDVDVTRVVTAAVGIGGRVLARHVVPTGPGEVAPESVAQQIADAVPTLTRMVGGAATPVGIGISVPGTVDKVTLDIPLAPNLGWRDVPFGELMRKVVTDLPVCVGNDADLAALAEHSRGSARGYDDVVYLLGRVGVGAGILTNGLPLRGAAGLAGEIGHTVLDASGPTCHCGGRGCVETYLGDEALIRLGGREAAVDDVLEAAARGERWAVRAVESVGTSLGQVVANIVNLLNPQVVVMGGSMRDILTVARSSVEGALERQGLAAERAVVALLPCALGGDGPLVGAAELAFGPLLADPLTVASLERAV
jgi:predicted NBD/HSP70 family sugar kinase